MFKNVSDTGYEAPYLRSVLGVFSANIDGNDCVFVSQLYHGPHYRRWYPGESRSEIQGCEMFTTSSGHSYRPIVKMISSWAHKAEMSCCAATVVVILGSLLTFRVTLAYIGTLFKPKGL